MSIWTLFLSKLLANVIAVFISAAIARYLWPFTMVQIFNLPSIDYWHMVYLIVTIRTIFNISELPPKEND